MYSACDSRLEPNPRPLLCTKDGVEFRNVTPIEIPDASKYPRSDDVGARAAAVATGVAMPLGFRCMTKNRQDERCAGHIQFGMKWCMSCHANCTYQVWDFEPLSDAEELEEVQAATMEAEEEGGGSGTAGAAGAGGGLAAAGDAALAEARARIERQVEELVATATACAIRDGPTFDVTAQTFSFSERVHSEWRNLQDTIRAARKHRRDFMDDGDVGVKT